MRSTTKEFCSSQVTSGQVRSRQVRSGHVTSLSWITSREGFDQGGWVAVLLTPLLQVDRLRFRDYFSQERF